MYDIFGKYGAIRQIRLGDKKDTRGTAYVVYEDIYDAKQAVEHLSGFNVANRYLIVLYFNAARGKKKKIDPAELAALQEKHGVDGASDRVRRGLSARRGKVFRRRRVSTSDRRTIRPRVPV
jgi:pre-mRNA branch site protein p14